MNKQFLVHLNFAVALDERGTLTFGPGTSCATDLERTHQLRETHAAIAVGANTWKAERPQLTARREILGREPVKQPARMVFTRTGLPGLLQGYFEVKCEDGNLCHGLHRLADQGLTSLFVEGGPTLLRSFLRQGLADAFTVYLKMERPERALSQLYDLLICLPRSYRTRPFGEGHLAHFLFESNVAGIQPHQPVSCLLRSKYGALRMHVFEDPATGANHIALVKGDVSDPSAKSPLVRIHSSCQTGEVFASLHCDCNHQLESALEQIAAEGCGVLVYLEQEGRGIGIRAKALAYELQNSGFDTFEANQRLGLPRDARHYGFAAHILRYLGVRRLRLLTTNPDKLAALLHEGIEVIAQIPLTGGANPVNFRYLTSKVASGHDAALLA